MTCCSETFASLSFFGSTCTCNCLARSPQMETLATPGTPSRRGMIVQRASTDIWIGVSVFEVTPTISTRLVDESGCRICGGFETFGSACACVMRSATTCRAVKRSVPGSKMRKIRDMPGTDWERMSLRKAMPLSRSCSIGTVISCSTSADDNPSASVCTSTVTGAYSGRTSTGIERSSETPTISVSAPRATTSSRNFMLQATIQPVIAGAPSAPWRPRWSSDLGPGAHPVFPGGFGRDIQSLSRSLTPPVSRPHSPVSLCGGAM